jgi:hypothetical protein
MTRMKGIPHSCHSSDSRALFFGCPASLRYAFCAFLRPILFGCGSAALGLCGPSRSSWPNSCARKQEIVPLQCKWGKWQPLADLQRKTGQAVG